MENSVLCKYADDGTLYASGEYSHMIMKNLKVEFTRTSIWFHESVTVLNPDICHFLVLGDPKYTWNLTRNGETLKCSIK